LEAIFAHEAPDFWSIRGTVARLEPMPSWTLGDGRLRTSASIPGSVSEAIQKSSNAVAQARVRVEANPTDTSALRALEIQLIELATSRGLDTEQRTAAIDEAIAIAERLVRLQPDGDLSNRHLALTLS